MAFNNKVLDGFIFSFILNSYNFKISFRDAKTDTNGTDAHRVYFPYFPFICLSFFLFSFGWWDRVGAAKNCIKLDSAS